MRSIKDIFALFLAGCGIILVILGWLLVFLFAAEFIVYTLYNLFMLELGPLASLWSATWHTALLVAVGGLFLVIGSAITEVVSD